MKFTFCKSIFPVAALGAGVWFCSGVVGGQEVEVTAPRLEPPATASEGVAAAPSQSKVAPEAILCDGLPYVDRGVAMAPLRPVCAFLRVEVTYHDDLLTLVKSFDGAKRTVTLRPGGKGIQVFDSGATRTVNLPLPVESRLGSIFVPAKFLVEILGGQLVSSSQGVPEGISEGARRGLFTTNGNAVYKGKDGSPVTISNNVGRALSLRLSGPQKFRLELGQGAKISLLLKPGIYYFQASCSGLPTISGSRRLLAGRKTAWVWGKK